MILTTATDAEARQVSPSSNYASATKLSVNHGGSSDARHAFIYFPRPFPLGAAITSATLNIYLAGSWSGSNHLTASRIITKWSENVVTWNTQPSVTSTHAAGATVTAGTDGQLVTFDVTHMVQDVSNGGLFFGFRIELAEHVTRAFYSAEWGHVAVRPTLELEWSGAPEPPDRLGPDGGLAVSAPFPILKWRFSDVIGDKTQSSAQIQLHKDTAIFTTPDYDTGKIPLEDSQWESDDGSFTGISNGEIWYWRVKVWDGTDLESEWSDAAVFTRESLGTLTIDSPGSTAPETTPPIVWTLYGGRTQESWRVILYQVPSVGRPKNIWHTSGVDATTDTVTPPHNKIKSGLNYRVRVDVWDTVDRYAGEHNIEHKDFVYVLDGTPDPVTSIVASGYNLADGSTTPGVQLDWVRDTAPDAWCLLVDGVEVYDDIELDDTHVAGDNYRLIYWGARPRTRHTYEIRAVVYGVGHSSHNDTVSFASYPIGIWLVDDRTPGLHISSLVCVYGDDEADIVIGETGTTYMPIGSQSPVRITDIIRGYEGTVTGLFLSRSARNTFLNMKELEAPVRLVLGDVSIPIRIEEVHVAPTPLPGDTEFSVSFTFFQCGPPWPVDQ